MSKIQAAITGVHAYVPDYVLTNKELETMVDTNDEWIVERTGVRERRILKGEGQGVSVMAIEAVKGLLEKTNTDPSEIDLVICATVTPDMLFPDTANLVAEAVGIKNAFCFDIGAACSGFLFALTTCSKYVESGTHKKVIVIGADKMSSIVDYTDRSICILFGDAAGAVLLEPNTEGYGIQDSYLKSDGSGQYYLYQKAGGSRYPATVETVLAKDPSRMNNIESELKALSNALPYKINPSVATNDLTVALTHADGTAPSSTRPLYVRINDTWYSFTAATTYKKNDGTNWHNAGSTELAGNPIDFFLYAIAETGATGGAKIGHSRIPYATTMADFVNTTTNEKYIAGNWTNFNSTDKVQVIGRFRAQLSATPNFYWSIATALVINKPIDQTDWLIWTPVVQVEQSDLRHSHVSTGKIQNS